MEKTYRTKEETIKYFEYLAFGFSKQSHREKDQIQKAILAGKSEAYEIAAFELKNNMI